MTADEFAALQRAADHDVDVVVRACAPLDWRDGDWREEKMAFGCVHPLTSIVVGRWEGLRPIAMCEQCGHELDPEVVNVRLNQR